LLSGSEPESFLIRRSSNKKIGADKNDQEQESEALYERCVSLEKKLRDVKFRISTIADECQYEHSLNDSIYICLRNLFEDNTAWEL